MRPKTGNSINGTFMIRYDSFFISGLLSKQNMKSIMFNINIHCTYQFVFEILLNEDSNQQGHLRQFHQEQISDVLSLNPTISDKCTEYIIIYEI